MKTKNYALSSIFGAAIIGLGILYAFNTYAVERDNSTENVVPSKEQTPEPVIDRKNLPPIIQSPNMNEDGAEAAAIANAFINYAAYNHDPDIAIKLVVLPFGANNKMLHTYEDVKKFLEQAYPVGKGKWTIKKTTVMSRPEFVRAENLKPFFQFMDAFDNHPSHYLLWALLENKEIDNPDDRKRDQIIFTRVVNGKTMVTGLSD